MKVQGEIFIIHIFFFDNSYRRDETFYLLRKGPFKNDGMKISEMFISNPSNFAGAYISAVTHTFLIILRVNLETGDVCFFEE